MNVELETAWPPLAAVIVGLLLVAGILWSYRWLAGKATVRSRRLFLALRLAAAALLLLLALEPVWRADRLRAEDARVVVLLDTSASMATPDSYDDRSRYDVARDLLFADGGLADVLGREIPVHVRRFDVGPKPTDPDELPSRPDGGLTDLTAALREVGREDGRTAAVILVSDGADNAGGDPREAAASVTAPIFAVGLGRPAGARTGAKDLAVTGIDAPETALVNNAVVAEVTLRSSGYDLTDPTNRTVRVTLSDEGREIAAESVELTEDGLPVRVDLRAVPDRVGTFTYRVEVTPRGDEATADNNVRTFSVEALDRRITVLYVEGAARWEYKWIKTALQRDPAIAFTGLVATGRGTYLVQGERPEADVSRGLPASADDYASVDVVLLGDVGAASFEPAPLAALRGFVENGGGLLVLGGYQAFGAGGWDATPLRDLLPVLLTDEEQIESPFTPVVTAEGRAHPVLAGLVDLFEAEPRPSLEGCSPLGRSKPGATVLLEHPEGARPVLAVHRFGEGRVAAFAGDTTYAWALAGRSGGDGSGLHERFYGQLVRGLFSPAEAVERSGEPFAIWTDGKLVRLHEEVRIRARVRGEDGAYLDEAAVSCTVMGPGSETVELDFVPVARLRGHYEARFRPGRPGTWILSGRAEHRGRAIGQPAGQRIEVSTRTIESEETGIRDDLLRAVAAASGGRYYPLPASRRIPADVLGTLRDEMVREETRLWNAPLLFVLFVGLLGAEWIYRKRSHLL